MMTNNKFIFQKRLKKFIPPKDTWTSIDNALFTPKTFFKDYHRATELTFKAIKYSFKHHFDNNTLYHRLCEVNKISPDMIKSGKKYSLF